MIIIAVQIFPLIIGVFVFYLCLRQVLFYGFTPVIATRPGEVKKILNQTEINIKRGVTIYALGFGRSGFLKVAEKMYPEATLVGAEDSYFYYLMAKIQVFLKRSKIKVIFSDFYRLNVRKADIVYCYLIPKDLRDIYKKLIVDTKDGVQIISTGFAMPYLEPIKTIEIESKKRWFSFFAKRNKEFLTTKERMEKRDNKIYFYEL